MHEFSCHVNEYRAHLDYVYKFRFLSVFARLLAKEMLLEGHKNVLDVLKLFSSENVRIYNMLRLCVEFRITSNVSSQKRFFLFFNTK